MAALIARSKKSTRSLLFADGEFRSGGAVGRLDAALRRAGGALPDQTGCAACFGCKLALAGKPDEPDP
ncbi:MULTISPECIES: hypothetical protein [unclassified Bradyrhizobium]|uniref:hypothetical protein n=1 Tax=unclassified Bradyrhizobium TaxID=2631580 RepID=UPI0029166223|nr:MULTISPECIES: hypothetical protein [unclassified Bradyrhizobium]